MQNYRNSQDLTPVASSPVTSAYTPTTNGALHEQRKDSFGEGGGFVFDGPKVQSPAEPRGRFGSFGFGGGATEEPRSGGGESKEQRRERIRGNLELVSFKTTMEVRERVQILMEGGVVKDGKLFGQIGIEMSEITEEEREVVYGLLTIW